ncbi:hypothetical protein C8R46DRAFT_1034598 [Mycena filopes]|nr:hypothetical protein C8R46DRAFT_1034598 [Mycena filopes]
MSGPSVEILYPASNSGGWTVMRSVAIFQLPCVPIGPSVKAYQSQDPEAPGNTHNDSKEDILCFASPPGNPTITCCVGGSPRPSWVRKKIHIALKNTSREVMPPPIKLLPHEAVFLCDACTPATPSIAATTPLAHDLPGDASAPPSRVTSRRDRETVTITAVVLLRHVMLHIGGSYGAKEKFELKDEREEDHGGVGAARAPTLHAASAGGRRNAPEAKKTSTEYSANIHADILPIFCQYSLSTGNIGTTLFPRNPANILPKCPVSVEYWQMIFRLKLRWKYF